jgi:hypothetical protein
MKTLFDKLFAHKEEVRLCSAKNILDCPEYWTKLATTS